MSLYVLDTNMISYLVRNHPVVSARVTATPMSSLSISAITEGELLFGLEKKPAATRLRGALTELLRRITVLPWDRLAATRYGRLRVVLERSGMGLGDIDLLIAAHAVSVDGVLVTADKAFFGVPDLAVEDWTRTVV